MFHTVAKIELWVGAWVVSCRCRGRPKAKNGTFVQTTLKSAVSFKGVGLHTGASVTVTVRPASAEHGIWFQRTDVSARVGYIPARWDAVVPSRLCTQVSNRHGTAVSTIEHLMAALAGCGIHNAMIEIDGPEVPILDGSAAPFVAAFVRRGFRDLASPVRAFKVLRPVMVTEGEAWARLDPSDMLEIAFEIEFADQAIGRQSKALNMSNGAFVRELCDSRTFCRQQDVEQMRLNGLALGGTMENAVVVDGDRVLSPGGFRHPDEAVRHKMLDALGDLALAGAPILGRYAGHRAGHALTNQLLKALFAAPDAFRLVDVAESTGGKMPGVGVTSADLSAFA